MLIREEAERPRWATAVGLVAVVFGLATIGSGGVALFGGEAARAAVGNAVPFVLWFNFLAGFAYAIAGLGLFRWRPWAVSLATLLALATVLVFAAFAVHVAAGGAFEMRTVFAMTLRSLFWVAVAIAGQRALRRRVRVS